MLGGCMTTAEETWALNCARRAVVSNHRPRVHFIRLQHSVRTSSTSSKDHGARCHIFNKFLAIMRCCVCSLFSGRWWDIEKSKPEWGNTSDKLWVINPLSWRNRCVKCYDMITWSGDFILIFFMFSCRGCIANPSFLVWLKYVALCFSTFWLSLPAVELCDTILNWSGKVSSVGTDFPLRLTWLEGTCQGYTSIKKMWNNQCMSPSCEFWRN